VLLCFFYAQNLTQNPALLAYFLMIDWYFRPGLTFWTMLSEGTEATCRSVIEFRCCCQLHAQSPYSAMTSRPTLYTGLHLPEENQCGGRPLCLKCLTPPLLIFINIFRGSILTQCWPSRMQIPALRTTFHRVLVPNCGTVPVRMSKPKALIPLAKDIWQKLPWLDIKRDTKLIRSRADETK